MVTNILKVIAFLAVSLTLLVACADKGYIDVPTVRLPIEKVHASAVACTHDMDFDAVNLRPVSVDKQKIGDRTVVTISPVNLQNLVYNLKTIDQAGIQRDAYSQYLKGCLEEIAELSVTSNNTPE